MRERKKNGSKLFLTELMISIFFFTIVVSVCIQLFSEAHRMSEESQELTKAVNICSNVADYYMTWNNDEKSWNDVLGNGDFTDNGWSIKLDDNMKASADGDYLLSVVFSKSNGLEKATIILENTDKEKTVYQLEVERRVYEE